MGCHRRSFGRWRVGRRNISFEGKMGDIMDNCGVDLVEAWGLGLETIWAMSVMSMPGQIFCG